MRARSQLRSSLTGKIRGLPDKELRESSGNDPEVMGTVLARTSFAKCAARGDEEFSCRWVICRSKTHRAASPGCADGQ